LKGKKKRIFQSEAQKRKRKNLSPPSRTNAKGRPWLENRRNPIPPGKKGPPPHKKHERHRNTKEAPVNYTPSTPASKVNGVRKKSTEIVLNLPALNLEE